MKFLIKDFFSKCNQIPRKLRIWSHLLKKSLFVLCKHFYSLNLFLSISFIYFISFIFAQLFLWSICLFEIVFSITSQRFLWFLEAKQILEYACVLWCSWYRYHFFICIYSCFCNWISILFKILYFWTFRSILGIQSHYYDLYGFVVLYGIIFYIYLFLINTALKVVVCGVILVHSFPH